MFTPYFPSICILIHFKTAQPKFIQNLDNSQAHCLFTLVWFDLIFVFICFPVSCYDWLLIKERWRSLSSSHCHFSMTHEFQQTHWTKQISIGIWLNNIWFWWIWMEWAGTLRRHRYVKTENIDWRIIVNQFKCINIYDTLGFIIDYTQNGTTERKFPQACTEGEQRDGEWESSYLPNRFYTNAVNNFWLKLKI